jgi:hypothetical protein
MNDYASEIESARAEVAAAAAEAFPDLCTVEEDAGGQGADGGLQSSWRTLSGHTNIPCKKFPVPGIEQLQQAQVVGTAVSRWKMPVTLADGSLNRIAAEHRFTVATRGILPARTLYVTDVAPAGEFFFMVTAKADG